MKTIIVAIDYSPRSMNALEYAAQLAQATGSDMVLFNAFHLPVPTSGPMPNLDWMIEENKARLKKIAHEIIHQYGLAVEVQTGRAPITEELENLSRLYEEPLVAVGMRGGSLARKLFGSVTISLLQQGKYPVLVIPSEARFSGITKILFACDYESLSVLHPLSPLKELALSFKARVQILHIKPVPAFAIEEAVPKVEKGMLEVIFRGIKHSYKEVENDRISKSIEKGIADFNADMLVMVPERPGFWDIILNRSKTRKMALKTTIPLLALPNPDLKGDKHPEFE